MFPAWYSNTACERVCCFYSVCLGIVLWATLQDTISLLFVLLLAKRKCYSFTTGSTRSFIIGFLSLIRDLSNEYFALFHTIRIIEIWFLYINLVLTFKLQVERIHHLRWGTNKLNKICLHTHILYKCVCWHYIRRYMHAHFYTLIITFIVME